MKKLLTTIVLVLFAFIGFAHAQSDEDYGERIEINYAYEKDDKYVYYFDDIIEGADPVTFELIDDDYCKDKNHIFYYEDILEGADVETFEVIDYSYSKDKNGTYYCDEFTSNEEMESIEEINSYYSKTKNNVYYTYYSFKKLEGADPETFEMDSSNGFAKDKNNVYLDENLVVGSDPNTFAKLIKGNTIESDDPDTYELISHYFYSDVNNVYYGNEGKAFGADVDSFEVITKNYSKDKNNVYYVNKCADDSRYCNEGNFTPEIVEGVDLNTFEIINERYSKDKNNVYYRNDAQHIIDVEICDEFFAKWEAQATSEDIAYAKKICSMPDSNTFEVLSRYYSKDKYGFYYSYYNPQLVEEADYDTFELINEFLARDKNHVYDKGDVLDWIDAYTLKIINKNIIADKDHVYDVSSYPEIIEGISAMYFEGFNDRLFRGEDNFYEIHGDQIYIVDGVQRHSFEMINDKYAKDSNHVYDIEYDIEIIDGVDPDTFESINDYYTKDKYSVYGTSELDLSDPDTFEVINEGYNRNYGKDSQKVYVNSTIIPYADPDTFEYVGLVLSKDKRHVYMFAEALEGVGTNVEFLNDYTNPDDDYWYNYFTDGQYIYCIDGYASIKRLDWVDVDSFEIVNEHSFKDKNGLYINSAGYSSFSTKAVDCYASECNIASSHVSSSELIMSVEVDDYEKINDFYIKDDNNAYYMPYGTEYIGDAMPIFDIHSQTFEVIGDYYTKDYANVYYMWFPLKNADPATFELLADDVAKDKNNVYYMGDVITGYDPETFEIIKVEVDSEWYESLSQEALDKNEEVYGENWYSPEYENQIKDKNGIYKITDGRLVNVEDKKSYQYLRKKLLNGGFTDVGQHELKGAIEDLTAMGVITGYDDGTFRPDQTINRAEALKIIFESLEHFSTYEYQNQDFDMFSDIEEDAWYKPYVQAGVEKEIIKGYPDGTFKGANTVNLAEALKMLYETYDIHITRDQTGIWYYKYYRDAARRFILPQDLPEPTKLLTRAEFAYIVMGLKKAVEKDSYGSFWDDAQDLRSRGLHLEDEIVIHHELKGSNRIKWSWDGPETNNAVFYELWTGDKMLGRTENKYLITEFDECSLFQSVRLRVAKVEKPEKEEDWSFWSKTYEDFLGEDSTATQRDISDLLFQCLNEDLKSFSDKVDFAKAVGNFDPVAGLNLEQMSQYGLCMVDEKFCDLNSYSIFLYEEFLWAGDMITGDLSIEYENMDRIPKSAIYAFIAGLNNLRDFDNAYKMAEWDYIRIISGSDQQMIDSYYRGENNLQLLY